MAERQYIGARYVPVFADPVEWDNVRQYEALTIVTHLGNSFTSRKPVPAGVDIANGEYWVNTGNYNAQVATYQKQVINLAATVENLPKDNKTLTVSKNGGQFATITDAYNFAKSKATQYDRYTILVYPGTYAEAIDFIGNPGVDIVGVNRETCIMEVTADAPNACIYTGSNMNVSNMTFINHGTGYAVHLEAQADASANGNFRAVNCTFRADKHAGVGAGFGPNFGGEFTLCKFVTASNLYAALYCHNHPKLSMESALRCFNCTFENGAGGDSIIIENAHKIYNPELAIQSTLYLMFRSCTSRFNKLRFNNGTTYGYIPNNNDGEIALIGCCGNTLVGLNNDEGQVKLGGYATQYNGTITVPVSTAWAKKYNWTVGQLIINSVDQKSTATVTVDDSGYMMIKHTSGATENPVNFRIDGVAK